MDKNIVYPFFSIIIPTYNRASLIGKTIDSVLQQHYLNYEIIIVDDGSTDNTEEVLKKYKAQNFTYVKKQNAERAAARNFGTKLAKGDYVNWFDSDDIMLPNHLTEAVNMITKYKLPEIFAVSFQFKNSLGIITRPALYPDTTINASLYKGNYLACNPVFVRTDIALLNQFNEDRDLSVSEDFELWLRMAARYPIYCSNTITSSLILHDERSMNTMNTAQKLIPRFKKVNDLVDRDTQVATFLGNKKRKFLAINFMLLSSTLSIAGYKKLAIIYSWKAIVFWPGVIAKKTFWVMGKHFLYL